MTHWPNPWPEAVPVSLETIADLVAGGAIRQPDGSIVLYDAAYALAYFKSMGAKLDPYLLSGGGRIQAGVRYGAEGNEYISPYLPLERQGEARAAYTKAKEGVTQ